ncbi:protein MRG1 [Citrus sinensis]|nr:protein MRG1 [Citrus sinensis]
MGSSSKDDTGSDGDTSSRDTPPSNSSLFSEGERVLAYHGPCIYEAKVQKAELRKKEWRYYVHYLGWNKKVLDLEKSLLSLGHLANSWDEWVGVDRLLKHTEENVMKQQALQKKQGADRSSKSGRSAQTKQKSSTDVKVEKEDIKSYVAKGKKRKSDSGTEKDNVSVEKLVKIQIPSTLKKQLVDDWEFVNQQDKLVKLPRLPNVDDILTKYLQYRSKKDGMMTDSIGEILKGIRCYFDKALPVMLLYKKERQQYHDLVVDNVSPSTIYGAEHLLRLFVKLPELLAYVNIEDETLIRLQQKMIDFLKFMQKNQSTFFLSAYDGSRVSEGKGKGKDE